jgi:hypothetical protein
MSSHETTKHQQLATTGKVKGYAKGGPVKKAMGGAMGGGAGLPAQASARAGQAMAARPAMPAKAMGSRPFSKGGKVKPKC